MRSVADKMGRTAAEDVQVNEARAVETEGPRALYQLHSWSSLAPSWPGPLAPIDASVQAFAPVCIGPLTQSILEKIAHEKNRLDHARLS